MTGDISFNQVDIGTFLRDRIQNLKDEADKYDCPPLCQVRTEYAKTARIKAEEVENIFFELFGYHTWEPPYGK